MASRKIRRGKPTTTALTTARDDYPNFAFWAQHGPAGATSDTGREIIRALAEIERLRVTVDMLRDEVRRLGVDPDGLEYPL